MFCIKCGQPIDDGSVFCPHCGTSQAAPPPQYQQQAQPQYQPPAQYPYQPPVQPQYQPPVQPQYQPPVQPQYQPPVQPQYQPPVQPQYQPPVQPQYQPPVQPQYQPGAQALSWKAFYEQCVSKKAKNTVTWMVVICFFTAVASIGVTAALSEFVDPIDCIMDVVVYSLSGVLLLATKHWATVLLPTIYGAIWTLVSMANDGTPTGFVAIIVGVTCISVLKKADKAYKDYKATGVLPAEQI